MIDLPVWALLIACSGSDCQPAAMGPCFPRTVVAEHLRGARWREVPVWTGLTSNGSVMELWMGDNSWTLLETVPTMPERMSCYRNVGTSSSGVPRGGSPVNEGR